LIRMQENHANQNKMIKQDIYESSMLCIRSE